MLLLLLLLLLLLVIYRLRILFDRLHDRGEPLFLFSVILPSYTKLALTHHSRNTSGSPLRVASSSSTSTSSSSAAGSMYDMSPGSSRIRNDLIKDVGRLVWLLPQFLQWRPRRLRNTTRAAAAAAAMQSPLQQQQQQYDIQIVELKDGAPLAARARDGDHRQQQLRRHLIAYSLQWQNCCLRLQEQHQDEILLLRKSRELLMQHGSWMPGFNVETVPSPPSATPPELPQQELHPQLLVQQPPGAFKGDPLIGNIGGSPVRCTQQHQQQRAADSQQAKQQQQQLHLLQHLQQQGCSKSVSPVATPVTVSGASSVNSWGTEQSPPQAAPSRGPSPHQPHEETSSSPLLLSPLTRGRQPLRRLPLLPSCVGSRSPSPPLERRSTSSSTSPTR